MLQQDGGNGFYSNPEVVISGIHDVAIASVDQIINGGIGPLPSDGTGISISHSGSGYLRSPSLSISGDGYGAKAFARRNGDEISDIIVRSPGVDYTSAQVIFSGGHQTATAESLIQDGRLKSIQVTDEGSGYLSGTINHINVSDSGSGFVTAPTVFISDPTGLGTTAQAVAQINFEGQLQSITITDMGSGYDTQQTYSGSTVSYDSNSNLIASTETAFISFLQNLVVGANLAVGDIHYNTIRIDGSAQNDGYYSIITVSNAGVEVFPNLVAEPAGSSVTLTAIPSAPTVTIIGGGGTGARAEAFITKPTVTLRDVRPLGGLQAAQARTPIYISAEATDPLGGVVTNVEFYANGILIPANPFNGTYSASWRPDTAGVYEIVSVAFDDDGNSTASTPVEFRITDVEEGLPIVDMLFPQPSTITTTTTTQQVDPLTGQQVQVQTTTST
ncbi:MAG: hypothetical protein VXB01_17585, partial [Opitutae bacterium]